MNALITKVIVEIGRTLGKAVIAGIGVEIAKVAGTHLQKRLAAKDRDKDAKGKHGKDGKDGVPVEEVESVKAENERLRAEIDRLREELAAARD